MKKKITLSPEDKLNQQRLQAAVRLLKSKGIITRDSEIAESIAYTAATVSEYINGKKPVSYAFIKYFEDHYKIKFSEIKIDGQVDAPMDGQTRLLMMIAEKVGISKKDIMKVLK